MGKQKNGTKDPAKDICYTPEYAVCPELVEALERLRQVLKMKRLTIWESACGNGMMVRALEAASQKFRVIGTDLALGDNYFASEPTITGKRARKYHAQVTNPPYTQKYPWIGLGLARGLPMALLMQIDVFGSKEFHTDCSIHVYPSMIWLNERVDYYMPEQGFEGSGAQFTSAWFTWGLDLPAHTYADITAAKKRFEARLEQDEQERAGQTRLRLPTLFEYAGLEV